MKKKMSVIMIVVAAACLLFSGIYIYANRSVKREPTQQELEASSAYVVDWQQARDQKGTDKEIILGLCTYVEKRTIGETVYDIYTSDVLGAYLHNFHEMKEIALYNNENLFIQYTESNGNMVLLGYDEEGLTELGIYDAQTDTFFHNLKGSVEVWTNFRTGMQFTS